MYKKLIKPILFCFEPEFVHKFIFFCLSIAKNFPFIRSKVRKSFVIENPNLEREVFGIKFPNPVGLAAGLDKNATAFDMLGDMGFGFVEIGTVTPKPQSGNPTPRIFRLPKNKALINRMGFNNEGVLAVVERLRMRNSSIIIGGNIGKNKITDNNQAFTDYEYCFNELFNYVDYFVVNVSSPNTPNLRELQDKEPLEKLLKHLMRLNSLKEIQKPVLLKIAPDLTTNQLDDIIEIVKNSGISGVVATNTTISRDKLDYSQKYISSIGMGGLSGTPVKDKSTEVIRYLVKKSNNSFPIIGVGGIMNEDDAIEKLQAGAKLVQLYTGFIYEGPELVKRINQAILKLNK
ncbi:MAG: quinone-dependent dihydroorotate dehydrogenase [Bacteroidales bacterium]|nr:quinone-dependent dihydroorotate dehydrogenase [Bacteroidales bacterium]